jgi:predicted lipoprotein with Yx(FWY)xxD motif
MNKNMAILIGVIVVIVAAGGGYILLHKSGTSGLYSSPSSNASSSGSSSTKSTATVNNSVVKTKNSAGLGNYLTDASGNALYTYGSDTSGMSNCSGSCLANWPAYQDKGATSGLPTNVSTIKRTDNSETQYTYKGLPLYTFTGDSAGQATGDGVSNFHIAKP